MEGLCPKILAELAIGHVCAGLIARYNKDEDWPGRSDASTLRERPRRDSDRRPRRRRGDPAAGVNKASGRTSEPVVPTAPFVSVFLRGNNGHFRRFLRKLSPSAVCPFEIFS